MLYSFNLIREQSKAVGCKFVITLILYYINRLFYKRTIIQKPGTKIINKSNINVSTRLEIGMSYVGFTSPNDYAFLNIRGKLNILGWCSIGVGCKFDVGPNGKVSIGHGTYINPYTRIIIMHELDIGENCAISWDCQFLDENFHTLKYDGKKLKENSIQIGNKVWIGSGVKIYKGTIIPDGCVIASDSIVKGVFVKKNVLIGGNPAKIIKENIVWH